MLSLRSTPPSDFAGFPLAVRWLGLNPGNPDFSLCTSTRRPPPARLRRPSGRLWLLGRQGSPEGGPKRQVIWTSDSSLGPAPGERASDEMIYLPTYLPRQREPSRQP